MKTKEKPKKYTPASPAEADLLRGVGLAFDHMVDSLQNSLTKLIKENTHE